MANINTEELKSLAYDKLVSEVESFKKLKKMLLSTSKMSLTGITNMVVNYEEPSLIDNFLDNCFDRDVELYKGTHEIDAVELQQMGPGQGFATQYLDRLIYGDIEQDKTDANSVVMVDKLDPKTGKRVRISNGFVNRKDVRSGEFKDKWLIIRNVDHCMDFCPTTIGAMEQKSLNILDNFRNPKTRRGCRLILISNKKLNLPFQIPVIEFPPVVDNVAEYILNSYIELFSKFKYKFHLTESNKSQIIRKVCGLTYAMACDSIGEAMMLSRENEDDNDKKTLNTSLIVRNLRRKINDTFIHDAVGLTNLTPKPWADYICPESSNFTYDVKKILRDFNEISRLKDDQSKLLVEKKDDTQISNNISAIQSRMPHVIVLYGRGGVGKSAFPVHFAGLLDFDVVDFNIGASHSKWVGEGAKNMREALDKIKKTTHVVVRIDEYDRAIGSSGASGSGMHESHKQVESEFMNWLQNVQEDNILTKNNIFIVLTTNHKDNITGPLLRSGRADLVIDIADFDEKSMVTAFRSAPTRMKNRGASVVGFTYDGLANAIDGLDIGKLAELTTKRGFTVRDVDILIQEMAAHNYYYSIGSYGIKWGTDSFLKVLEGSVGSVSTENTNELKLGDRFIEDKEETDTQLVFDFYDITKNNIKIEDFTDVSFFK